MENQQSTEPELSATHPNLVKSCIYYYKMMSLVVLDYAHSLQRSTLIKEIRTKLNGYEDNQLMKKAVEDALNVLDDLVVSTRYTNSREKYLYNLENRMDIWIHIMARTDPPEVFGLLEEFNNEIENLRRTRAD